MRVRWLATTHSTTCSISWFNFDIRFRSHSIAINTLLSTEPFIDFDFVFVYCVRIYEFSILDDYWIYPHIERISCFVWLLPYFKVLHKMKTIRIPDMKCASALKANSKSNFGSVREREREAFDAFESLEILFVPNIIKIMELPWTVQRRVCEIGSKIYSYLNERSALVFETN